MDWEVKVMFSARWMVLPIALLVTGTALGEGDKVEAARKKYSLIDHLDFSEQDLARLDPVNVTEGTLLWGDHSLAQAGSEDAVVAAPRLDLEWIGQDGEPFFVRVDSIGDASTTPPKIGISTPLVNLEERWVNISSH